MVAVFAWGGVEPSAEGAVHGLGRSEATGLGDLLDRSVGGFEEPACGLEPDGFDVIGGSGAHLGLEDSSELSLGEVDLSSERCNGEIVGQVVAEPGKQVTDRLCVGCLTCKDR